MRKKLLVFLAVLGFSISAFSQDQNENPDPSFELSGSIQNSVQKILVGNYLRANPETGQYFIPERKSKKDELGKFDQIVFTDSERNFSISNVAQSRFIVDDQSAYGKLIVLPEKSESNAVNIGKVTLDKMYEITGTISFPASEQQRATNHFDISISVPTSDGGMMMVAVIDLGKDKNFHVRLPNGKYIFFFDYQDRVKNWRRVTKMVEVNSAPFHFEDSIAMTVDLDEMVMKKTRLQDVIKNFDLNMIGAENQDVLEKITSTTLTDQITILYVFADYCGPCFSSKGLAKYLNYAHHNQDSLSIIAVHSDSYGFEGCPMSESEMKNRSDTQQKWKKLYEAVDETMQTNSKVAVIWQSGEFAKKMFVNGYPTVLVFKNNVLSKWFVGSDANVIKEIRKLP